MLHNSSNSITPDSSAFREGAGPPEWGIVGLRNAGIGQLGTQKGLERKHSRVKKAFLCIRTMGVLVPSLHTESTDSDTCTSNVQLVKSTVAKGCHFKVS